MTGSGPRAGVADRAASDAELVVAARVGDRDAWRALYARYGATVHGIVLAHTGRQDAEDLTQEVFASVVRRLDTLRDPATFGAWVCAVARNQAVDHLRRVRRRPSHEGLADVIDPKPRPEESLGHRVLELIRQLPEAYRETLVLRLVEGLTGPEIAARTGLTAGSVRVNLCRGMAQLRPLLREEGWS